MGDQDVFFPCRDDEEEGEEADDERLEESRVRHFEEASEHEGLELAGHIALLQGDHNAEPEEGGEDNCGPALVMRFRVLDEDEGGDDEEGYQGGSERNRVSASEGEACDDSREH